VQGNSGSGKSHLLRRLLEQSVPWVQQAVIDPEGDFATLAEQYGHVVIDAEEHTERGLQVAAERARVHRVSTILNLEGLDAENQMRRAAAFLGGLFDVARDHWYPMLVVVDEAQLFAPAVAGEVSDEARKLSLAAMTNLMCRGRKRGLAGLIATQRLAKLAKNVAAEAANFLMGRTFLDIDMARAADLLGMERRQADVFRDLDRGQFMALGSALSRRPMNVRIGPTETHSRHASPRLMPLPEARMDGAREIILAAPPPEIGRPARRPSTDIASQLMAAKETTPETVEQPLTAEQQLELRQQLDRILGAILAEPDADFRPVGILYQEFAVRCRIEGLGSAAPNLSMFRRMLTCAKAGLSANTEADGPWKEVSGRADLLPEDMQGVFLMIAHAARENLPCPSDMTIARVYGTHSIRRARRALAYIEEQGLLVSQLDGMAIQAASRWPTKAAGSREEVPFRRGSLPSRAAQTPSRMVCVRSQWLTASLSRCLLITQMHALPSTDKQFSYQSAPADFFPRQSMSPLASTADIRMIGEHVRFGLGSGLASVQLIEA
jgi:hypothetical protein